MTAPRAPNLPEGWTLDECEDASGYFTVRVADGSPNGDTSEQPIATAYHYENARLIAAAPELLAFVQRIAEQGVIRGDVLFQFTHDARSLLDKIGGAK